MAALGRRNALMPWLIGVVIIAIADLYVAYKFYSTNCETPGFAQFMVLVVVPGIYLALMYLTFRSQD